MGDRASDESAYLTRYFPGVSHRPQATVLNLVPRQELKNLRFSLSRPHKARRIRIEVVWPDGSTPDENLLQLFDGDPLVQNEGGTVGDQPATRHKGKIEVSGWAEREYEFHVRYWVDDLGGEVPHDRQRIALSDKVRLKPGSAPATIRLMLTKTRLAEDDQ